MITDMTMPPLSVMAEVIFFITAQYKIPYFYLFAIGDCSLTTGGKSKILSLNTRLIISNFYKEDLQKWEL